MRKRIFILLSLTLFLGCSRSFDDLDDFEQFVRGEQSPYLKVYTRNGVKVTLRYMPPDVMMIGFYRQYEKKRAQIISDEHLNEAEKQTKLAQEEKMVRQHRASYDQSLYFSLTIGYEDDRDLVYNSMQAGFGNYSEWIQKLMFKLEESIYLHTPAIEEVPLDTYHMERTFGMRKDRTFLLMFPRTINDRDLLDPDHKMLKLVIEEFGLKTGKITFTYDLPFDDITYRMK